MIRRDFFRPFAKRGAGFEPASVFKSFEAPLGDKGKDDLWREKKDLLDDPAQCAELIAGYQAGPGEPWFATERADVAGMEAKLGAAQGKEHVVVVGNGGSIRNVWALYLALSGRGFSRKLHLLDGTDMSGLFGELLRGDGAFDPENTLVVPVSKSGNTENVIQETALLMERGYPALAITSSGPSKLAEMVAEARLDTFPHPDDVGGRFTAAQNNALLPLAMLARRIRRWPGRSTPPSPPLTENSEPPRP